MISRATGALSGGVFAGLNVPWHGRPARRPPASVHPVTTGYLPKGTSINLSSNRVNPAPEQDRCSKQVPPERCKLPVLHAPQPHLQP